MSLYIIISSLNHLMKKLLNIFFFLLGLSLSVSAQTPPAYVPGQTGRLYKILNRQTGYILEIPANPNPDALEREGTGCTERSDAGTANQQWYINGDFSSNTNVVYIVNRNSNQLLTGNYYSQPSVYQSKQQYNSVGDPVQDQKQQWNFTKITDASGRTVFVIRNVSLPYALAPVSGNENAALSLQNLGNNNPLAQWTLLDITNATSGGNGALFPGTYKITNVNSGLTLQVVNQSGEPGARIEQGGYIGIASQQWQIIDQYNSSGAVSGFAIINRLSGLALQIVGQSTTNGAPIEQGKFIGIASQLWNVNSESGVQTVTFQNVNSGYVMQVTGQSTSGSAQMQQGGRVPIGSQLWKFEYVVPNRLAAPPTAATPIISEFESLTVYPNPSSGELNIAPITGEKLSELTILDMQGKVITKLPLKNGVVDVTFLTPGLYILTVKGEKSSYHTKFIKK